MDASRNDASRFASKWSKIALSLRVFDCYLFRCEPAHTLHQYRKASGMISRRSLLSACAAAPIHLVSARPAFALDSEAEDGDAIINSSEFDSYSTVPPPSMTGSSASTSMISSVPPGLNGDLR